MHKIALFFFILQFSALIFPADPKTTITKCFRINRITTLVRFYPATNKTTITRTVLGDHGAELVTDTFSTPSAAFFSTEDTALREWLTNIDSGKGPRLTMGIQ